jgi:hypothetical protein
MHKCINVHTEFEKVEIIRDEPNLKKQMCCNRSFENILLDAIDEGLSSVSDSAREAIYFHLKKSFNIEKRDIPYKIEEFDDAMEKIFGVGAKTLEIFIMKRLCEEIGQNVKYNRKPKDLVFTEYIRAAKQTFLKKNALEEKRYLRRTLEEPAKNLQ